MVLFYRNTHDENNQPKEFEGTQRELLTKYGFIVHMCDSNRGYTFDELIQNCTDYVEAFYEERDSLIDLMIALTFMVQYGFIRTEEK